MPFFSPEKVTSALLEWHIDNPRDLPWKKTRDPYLIWLSEIILQQTQVSQGLPYFLHFANKYPTVKDMANASEDEVLKDWQGLGYNSRARNMLKTARIVAQQYDGVFPDDSAGLETLPGVGSYTAAAIASFAYEEEVPVLDANVIRVMSRLLGIQTPPSNAANKKKLLDALDALIAHATPSAFNQAIMDFGARVCRPRNPGCESCPLNDNCSAFASGMVHAIPFKAPKKPRKNRYFHYMVIGDEDGLVLRKRQEKDIWQGMYDFPAIETASTELLNSDQIHSFLRSHFNLTNYQVVKHSTDSQVLSHQQIHGIFYTIKSHGELKTGDKGPFTLASYENLANFAVPKIIDCYLKAKSIHL